MWFTEAIVKGYQSGKGCKTILIYLNPILIDTRKTVGILQQLPIFAEANIQADSLQSQTVYGRKKRKAKAFNVCKKYIILKTITTIWED